MSKGKNQKGGNSSKQLNYGKVDRYTAYALKRLSIGLAKDGQPYAYLEKSNNWIAHLLTASAIKRWLRKAAHKKGEFLRRDDLNEILENLYAHAAVSDKRLNVHLRVGRNAQGDPELDLGTEDFQRILFKDGTAHVVKKGSKTLFARPDSMLASPIPAMQGNWKLLLSFLNMIECHQLLLVGIITWNMCHPRGTAPYPILVLQGQQGTGKSVLCKSILRPLVDNNAAGIQLYTGKMKDMAVSAQHQFLLIYDNLRSLTSRQSDDFCVIATGGSISSRQLYTDAGESLLSIHSPLVLNGIHHFVQEPDLASRCVTLQLLPLPEGNRREETDIVRDLEAKLPIIFKGLLDLCAQALAVEDSVSVIHPERLMNFSRWLAALEVVMDLPQGELQAAYSQNLRDAAMETVQDSAVAITLLRFAAKSPQGQWAGTPSDLLDELTGMVSLQTANRSIEWPQTPISLSKRLKKVAPLLKSQGLELGFSHGTQRRVEITYSSPQMEKAIDGIDESDELHSNLSEVPSLADCAPLLHGEDASYAQ